MPTNKRPFSLPWERLFYFDLPVDMARKDVVESPMPFVSSPLSLTLARVIHALVMTTEAL
jgi:hypothetical protein